MKQYRHGELLLCEVESIPEGEIPRKTNVVATGKTGHDHTLIGGQILENNNLRSAYLDITADGAGIDHEEHGKIALQPGEKYQVVLQREYDPYEEAARQVED